MKFELHCHSRYSTGSKIPWEGIPAPAEIIGHAKKTGLAGIAITDHCTTRAWDAARKEARRQGIIFIPGVELQTQSGHIIALGISEPVANNLSVDETIDRIRQLGGVSIAAHPFDLRGQGVKNDAAKADAVEVFNSLNIDKISNLYASSRFSKVPVAKVAGSDAHTLGAIGLSVNMMEAHDLDGVLRCIRKGRVSFEARYTPMDEVIEWARERLSRSRDCVLKHTEENYNPAKAWLYSKLLKKFLATSNTPWRVLAEMSLAAVRGYSMVKVLSY